MHIKLELRWRHGLTPDEEVDPSLFDLLRAIEKERALTRATRLTGHSYRHAWGMLRRWEQRFGNSLVTLERGRGRGARLTEFGAKLLELDSQLTERLEKQLDSLGAEFSSQLSELCQAEPRANLRLMASHGMAVRQFAEILAGTHGVDLNFQTRGSLDSLRALASGQCDLAGFHFPLEAPGKTMANQFLRWLDPDEQNLLELARRQQGLMTAPGNPKHIRSVKDLCKRSVRFINRQRGSGTRTILDALLQQESIVTSDINGYADEEFTHDAVAAMVASGKAHVGFGIEAAAKRFGLTFLPVLKEAYLLTARPGFSRDRFADIVALLKSRRYAERMKGVAGYDISQAGTLMPFERLFGASA